MFEKFGINPNEQVYFIAGSARLYLYESLIQTFNLKTIRDLDIVIPGEDIWKSKGIKSPYIPNEKIEVYSKWIPAKAIKQDEPDKVVDNSVRDSDTILKNAKQVGGYWFMSMEDVMDYKLLLNRDKEKVVTKLIITYATLKEPTKRQEIVKNVMSMFGNDKEAFKSFLNRGTIAKGEKLG